MVVVNKDEAAWIRAHIPAAVITRVNRQKPRRYRAYASEEPEVLRFLEEVRENPIYLNDWKNKKKGRN